MLEGQIFHIDTDRVKQYEGQRICADVIIHEEPRKYSRLVLCEIPSIRALCLVPRKELKVVTE